MVKTIRFLWIGGLLIACLAQSVRGGLPDSLDRQQVRYLAELCKVWGACKYYHPLIAKGEIDWNQQLIDVLPKVYKAGEDKTFNELIRELLQEAGPIDFSGNDPELLSDYQVTDYNNVHTRWIKQSRILDDTNKQVLTRLMTDFIPQPHTELEKVLEDGKTGYHENKIEYIPPSEEKMPRPNQRLADLFTLWNHLFYFFPYQDKARVEWRLLLKDFIPGVYAALEQKEYQLILQKFVARIPDSRAFSYNDFVVDQLGRYTLPIELVYINDTTYVERVGKKLRENWDIKPGQRIVSVDGVSIDSLRDQIRPYVGGAHDAVATEQVNRFILAGSKYSSANIKLADRFNATFQATPTRDFPNFEVKNIHPEGKVTKYLEEEVAYLDTKYLDPEAVKDAFKDIDDADYLVIDLRNAHNDVIASIEEYLTPEKKVVDYYHYPLVLYPGKFYTQPRENKYARFKSTYEGKLILLVDEKCKTTCELTVSAIQDSRNDVTLVGRPTAAALGATYRLQLPFTKTTITYTGSRVTDKQGQHAYPAGLQPDIGVPIEKEQIYQGPDPVIKRALQFIEIGE